MNLSAIRSSIAEALKRNAAMIAAAFHKYRYAGNLPAGIRALIHTQRELRRALPEDTKPASAPLATVALPKILSPELALEASNRVLGFRTASPQAPTLAAWREQIQLRLAGSALEKMAELGFPGQSSASLRFPLAALSARADGAAVIQDSPAARLAIVAEELRCTVDDLRKADSGEMIRARLQHRLGEMLIDGFSANIGVSVDSLPPYRGDGNPKGDLEEIQEQLATEKDPVRGGQLAAKANQLRDRRWSARPDTP